jgi:hypothetical protein
MGILLGLTAGLATQVHFLGVIAPITVLLAWLFAGRLRPSLLHLSVAGVVFLLALLPYGLFALRNLSDIVIQFRAIHGMRAEAAAGGLIAVLENLQNEPERYRHILSARTPGPWLLFPALAIVAWWLGRNWQGREAVLARAVAAYVLAVLCLLTLMEPTKAPLYTHPLVPALCLILALQLGAWLVRERGVARVLVASVLLLVAAEGATAVVREALAMRARTRYADVSRQIEAAIVPSGAASGATRWWWSQRHRPFTPFITILYRARTQRDAPLETAFRNSWNNAQVHSLIRTPELDADVARAGPEVAGFLSRVLQACGTKVLSVSEATYGPIDVFELAVPCAESLR